nr:hypothetical protein CFP56_21682 [Quercus suber]
MESIRGGRNPGTDHQTFSRICRSQADVRIGKHGSGLGTLTASGLHRDRNRDEGKDWGGPPMHESKPTRRRMATPSCGFASIANLKRGRKGVDSPVCGKWWDCREGRLRSRSSPAAADSIMQHGVRGGGFASDRPEADERAMAQRRGSQGWPVGALAAGLGSHSIKDDPQQDMLRTWETLREHHVRLKKRQVGRGDGPSSADDTPSLDAIPAHASAYACAGPCRLLDVERGGNRVHPDPRSFKGAMLFMHGGKVWPSSSPLPSPHFAQRSLCLTAAAEAEAEMAQALSLGRCLTTIAAAAKLRFSVRPVILALRNCSLFRGHQATPVFIGAANHESHIDHGRISSLNL